MKIVAFAGRKQSGKTTCSYYIENLILRDFQTSHSCKIYNFADPLKKDICMNILGLSYEQCYGEDSDKNTLTDVEWNGLKLTAREVMQFIGTDIFRKMKRDVWASATMNKIQEIRSLERHGYVAIIADCRFPNEVEAVQAALDPDNYYQDNFDLIIDNENLSIDEQNGYIHTFLKDKGILPL